MVSILTFVACVAQNSPVDVPKVTQDLPFEVGVLRGVSETGPARISWSDGRIVSVDRADVAPNGAWISVGLVDAHAHPSSLGRKLATLDVTGTASYADVLARIEAAEGSGWITGRGWDQNDWPDAPEGVWPLAADLHTDRPVALSRIDGHALWLNQVALDAAKITAQTKDPEGGRIVRDAAGAPTGVLVDNAMDLVPIPAASREESKRRLEVAVAFIASKGLTGVHDMGMGDGIVSIYTELDRAGELPIRVFGYVSPDSEAAAKLLRDGPWSVDRFSVVGIKVAADGALGSRGALLTDPYSDEPGHRGLSTISVERMTELATGLLAVEAHLAVHAIGDAAVHGTLDAFEKARRANPDKGHVPLRLEHAQVVRPEDVVRFKEVGAVASMQPTHCTSDMPWAPDRLGEERVLWAYRWRDFLDAGVPLAFGSDFPVEAVDPGLGLWSATTRRALDGTPEEGWQSDQVLTLDEAVAAFSSGAAVALGRSGELLAPGQLADLTIWTTEQTESGPRHRATKTIVGGETVFEGL